MSSRSSRTPLKSSKSQSGKSSLSSTSTSTKSVQKDAFFVEKLKQREIDLAMHRKKLEIAKQRHQKNVEIFESERNRIFACYNNASVEPFQISKKNVTQADIENINKNQDYIRQLFNDIHQQYLFSQKELDDAQNYSQKVAANDNSLENMNTAEKDVKGRKYIVEQFKQLLDRINNDTIPRESNVFDLEVKANRIDDEYQAVLAQKAEINKNLKNAQRKYKNAMKWQNNVESQNKKIKEENKLAKESLIDELRYQEELNRREEELKNLENSLQEKVASNDVIVKRIQDLRKSTIDMDTQRRSKEANLGSTGHNEAPTITELESLKFEVERAKYRANELEKMIEDMKFDPNSNSKISELKDQLVEAKIENSQLMETANSISQDDNDELKNKVAAKIREIGKLQSMILNEEVLEARSFKIKNDARALFALERSLMQRTATLNYMEEDIENDESAIIQAEDEIKREKNLILTKIAHVDKMLDLYRLQKQDADERLITIQNQFAKLKSQ